MTDRLLSFGVPLVADVSNFDFSVQTGGYVVEADENDRLVAKPYDVNQANKQKQE